MDQAIPPPTPPPTHLATTPKYNTAHAETLTMAPLIGEEESNRQDTTENVAP